MVDLPDSVQRLVRTLGSAAEIETLLLLSRERHAWTAPGVARKLRFDVDQAAAILGRLSRRNLLLSDGGSYRFHPGNPSEAQAVATLAELYPAYRLAVLSFLYATG